MASPRPPKTDPQPPDSLTVRGGGGAPTDKLTDVYQRLGGIQQSITYLEAHAADARSRLDSISTDITSAKATLSTLKIVLGLAGTILIAIWGFIATVLGMIAKHYLKF